MKVKELIKELEKLNQEQVVKLTDPECHDCRQIAVGSVVEFEEEIYLG